MEGEENEEPANTVSGILLVNHLYTRILFDSSATYSFINSEFTKKLTSTPDEMDIQLYVATPLGTTHHIDFILRDYAVKIERRTLLTDLVQLEIQGWDIILGMDWIARRKVTLDCEKKLNHFLDP